MWQPNADDAVVCSACGARLAGGTGDGPMPPATRTSPAASGGPPRRRIGSAYVFVVLAALAVAAVMAWTIIGRSDAGRHVASPTPVASGRPSASPGSAGLTPFLAAAVGTKGDELGMVAADGSVTRLAAGLGGAIVHIAYAPDGGHIAFISGGFGRSRLSVYDVAAGAVSSVAPAATPAVVAVDSAAWLDARHLLVAAFTAPPANQGENARLLIYDVSSGAVQPLTDGAGVALSGLQVSAARDGSRVAFVAYTDQQVGAGGSITAVEHLDVLDRFSGDVTELGAGKAYFAVDSRPFDDPLISPNGQAVIFRRAGSDVGTAYTVMSTSGGTLMSAKDLLFPAGYAWDPTSTKVVFTGQPLASDGSGEAPVSFYVFDTVARGAPAVIAAYGKTAVQDLAWSPDGSTIAWSEGDPARPRTGRTYLMSAAGGGPRLLAKWVILPAWAPGAKVAASPTASPSP